MLIFLVLLDTILVIKNNHSILNLVGFINLNKVVKNNSDHSIQLYPVQNDTNQRSIYMSAYSTLSYQYSGKSGKWQYVKFKHRIYFIKSHHVDIGYKVYNGFISQNWFNIILNILLIVVLLFLNVFLLGNKRKKIRRSSENINEKYIHEVDFYRQQANSISTEYKILSGKFKQQSIKLDIIEQNKEKQRYKQRLKNLFDKESAARHKTTISEMQLSYSTLSKEFEKIKREAAVFDINFDDPKYENLLKGRRYEICVATNLVKNKKFTILEWTPDKGFDSGIKVESNGNPDLVVKNSSGAEFAIECKYRSGCYRSGKKNEISWGSLYQAQRYQHFSNKRNMPVYIALGYLGEPTMPEKHFLISLDKLLSDSREDNHYGKSTQVIINENEIHDNLVCDGKYSKFLLSQENG